jgi:hypothetical protein
MISLSPETKDRIRKIFVESDWLEIEEYLLNECGDTLPLVETSYVVLAERIRFAVLKCSGGDYAELKRWVGMAKQDWRDVLVAAGFGNSINAHLEWQPG